MREMGEMREMREIGEMGEMRAAHRCSGHSAHVPGGLHDCELARAPLVLGESTVLLFVQREARARVRAFESASKRVDPTAAKLMHSHKSACVSPERDGLSPTHA